MLQLFVRAIFVSLRRRARRKWGARHAQCGAVTFVQRFGDALNLNVHFHSLETDPQRCASRGARPGEAAGAEKQVPGAGGRAGAQPMATPWQESRASRLGDGSASPHVANVGREPDAEPLAHRDFEFDTAADG